MGLEKRALLFFLVLVMTVQTVSATHSIFLKDSMEEGQTKIYLVDNGIYVIKVEVISEKNEQARFIVNSESSDLIGEGEIVGFKDGSRVLIDKFLFKSDNPDVVYFYFYGSGENPKKTDLPLNLINASNCNYDNNCTGIENSELCCNDCGCEDGKTCENDKCIVKLECTANKDCDDNNPCTDDSCQNNKCDHKTNNGCVLNNNCVKYGVINNLQYCDTDNNWKQQKTEGTDCKEDYECLTNICKDNKCNKNKGISFILILFIVLVIIIILFVDIKKLKRILNRF